MTELFRVDNLHAKPTEGDSEILRGFSLTVNEGEIHAIMGPNGCGKSTLANTLLASPEYEVVSGEIRFKGDDISEWPTDARAKAGIFLGALTLDQLWTARPVLGQADYRSPVNRLYHCGAGAHPGGGVTGLPGRNAAREIIRDFKSGRMKERKP